MRIRKLLIVCGLLALLPASASAVCESNVDKVEVHYAHSDEIDHLIRRKPSTRSEANNPPLGAKRRWSFLSTRSGRFGQWRRSVFASTLLSD